MLNILFLSILFFAPLRSEIISDTLKLNLCEAFDFESQKVIDAHEDCTILPAELDTFQSKYDLLVGAIVGGADPAFSHFFYSIGPTISVRNPDSCLAPDSGYAKGGSSWNCSDCFFKTKRGLFGKIRVLNYADLNWALYYWELQLDGSRNLCEPIKNKNTSFSNIKRIYNKR